MALNLLLAVYISTQALHFYIAHIPKILTALGPFSRKRSYIYLSSACEDEEVSREVDIGPTLARTIIIICILSGPI